MAAIYQADIWCDDCAARIKDDIAADIFKRGDCTGPIGSLCQAWELESVSCSDIRDDLECLDERDYDSDECPKYCSDDAESDCPQHCAGCQEFMGNDLTSEGVDYVKNAVREDIESGCDDSVAVTEWMPFYDWIDFDGIGTCDGCNAVRCELNDDYLCPDCAEDYDYED